MAGFSMISQFPTNSVSSIPPSHKLNSKISIMPTANSLRFPAKTSRKSNVRFARRKFSFTLQAAVDEDFEVENDGYVAEEPQTEIELLKKQLVDRFYGTNFGLNATSETRAEILELITQLEVMNPTPEPTKALPLLNGKWILAYTSCAGLYSLLSSGTLPLVKLEEISQTIDSENFTVQNGFVFSGLGSTTAITVNATFEVRSPKRVQIKFDEGIIGTPQLTDLIEIPESIEVLGQKVDLASFIGLIESFEDTVAKTISSQAPWKFSISETNVESWLLTTYLDGELRISREDCGKVFVLFKEGSPLLLL